MSLEEFWNIIDKAKHTQDHDEVIEIVKRELEKLSDKEIISYQNHFDILNAQAYTWDIWNAIYTINGGCGDSSFMDFRYTLIYMGKERYTNTLLDADSLFDLPLDEDDEVEFNESFGYIAIQVYEEKTGEEIYNYRKPIDEEENMGEEWDFESREECMKRLPKITQKFWEE